MPPARETPGGSTKKPGLPRPAGWRVVVAGAGLILAAFIVYHNSLAAPFQFDDQPAVRYNATIRHLWPLRGVLHPPAAGAGVTGRPLVNLSLAINYACGGLEVRGYHLLNVALHALATLALWGVLRRTLRRPAVPAFCREHGEVLAGSVALLWAVHPLLTETVVCVVQRNEVLGAWFYLLTLYGFIRSVDSSHVVGRDRLIPPSDAPRRDQRSRPTVDPATAWQVAAVAACLLGMASKEIMATAPLLVFLYDRTFVAGSFAAAWRQRSRFYLALASTWLLLAWLMLGNDQRAGTVGFGLGVSSWAYLLTQCRALTTYLSLSFWPHPLVVDYGTAVVQGVGEVWAQGLVVVALLLATGWALWRKPVLGFVGAWFFVILAPSSSFVPLTTQPMAEHRMYLPLAAVLVLGVAAIQRLAGRRSGIVVALLAAGLGWATWQRNEVYLSELSLWTDTVARAPRNQRAQLNLGQALFQAGRLTEAAEHFAEALQLKPAYAEAHYNLGLVQTKLGRPAEAVAHFEAALQCEPDYVIAHNDLGNALGQTGRPGEALAHFEAALRLRPDFTDAGLNRGNVLLQLKRVPEAIAQYEQILQATPQSAAAQLGWGNALAQSGRPAEAVIHFEAALRLQPDSAMAHYNLANLLLGAGRPGEAIPHYEAALRLQPGSVEMHNNLAVALMQAGRNAEAIGQYEETVRLLPASPELHLNLALALASAGRLREAVQHAGEALRLRPDFEAARHYLSQMQADLKRLEEKR